MFELAAKSIDWLLLNYWQLFENYDWIIDSQILTFAKSENILIFQLNSNILNILSHDMFQSKPNPDRKCIVRFHIEHWDPFQFFINSMYAFI